jgi:adenylate cyclase
LSLLVELRRRNVLRVGAAYIVLAWLVVQVVETVFPAFGFGDESVRIAVLVTAAGFFPTLIIAWVFEITPEGVKKEKDIDRSQSITDKTATQLDSIILALLVIALGYLIVWLWLDSNTSPKNGMEADFVQEDAQQTLGIEAPESAKVASVSSNSIAVLAFEDMSSEGDQQYMSEGVAEELLSSLAKIPSLRVTARTSAFSFRGTDTTIREIGRLLGVAYVVEGSVRTSQGQVRITAQLIEVATEFHVWSETYTRKLDDIFAIQDDIAARVAEKLKLSFASGPPATAPIDPGIYGKMLQALYQARQGTNASFAKSIEICQQVLIEAPQNIGCLAISGSLFSQFYGRHDEARVLFNQLLSIEPENAMAIAGLGTIALYEDDLALAAQYFRRALDTEISNPEVLSQATRLLQALGRSNVDLAEHVFTLDPLNFSTVLELGWAYIMDGRYVEAKEVAQKGLQFDQSAILFNLQLVIVELHFGNLPEALAAAKSEPFEMYKLISLISVYHAMGDGEQSDAYLKELVEKFGQDHPYFIAWPLAFRGDNDRAFEYLEKSVDIYDFGLYGILVNPGFSNLYSDSRWMPFLASIGRSPALLDSIEFDIVLPNTERDVLIPRSDKISL